MTSGSLPSNPFVAAGMIEDPRLFVGRKDELQAIASRMSGVQPTSVNVVGDKRIGKSSLLYHFFQTWEQRVADSSRYVVIYLSLQNVQCHRETDFYQAIAQKLLSFPRVATNPALSDSLRVTPLNRLAFSAAMGEWKTQGVLPVLCLDDFKMLFDNKSEFDDGFYNNLRSLMDNNMLMLVVGTTKELDFYRKQHQLTSSFFNLGHVLKLGELKEEEAKDLARLPASTVNTASAALSMDEQHLTRQLGGRHPFLLQIAGGLVCEARQQGHDENWVKSRFEEQKRRLPKSRNASLKLSNLWRWVHKIFSSIGAFGLWLAEFWNNAKTVVLGIVMVVLVIYCLQNPDKVQEFLAYLLNLTK
ncbi:AAA family ATPase [Nostocales cyanobacterium HT-58-2]|nr:AAA family ATPase [Nostocales cyanobacterium HT-58-2]